MIFLVECVPWHAITTIYLDFKMKKTYFSFLCLLVAFSAFSQTCVRDSSILLDSTIMLPRPYTLDYPVYALAPACIGEPYGQSLTLHVPDTILFQGIPLLVNNMSIATSGAITGLPSGITYLCDPPNCVFNVHTVGCILLFGTPNNPAQAPDTTDIIITATVSSSLGFPLPITFPGPNLPGNYFFVLAQAGNCITSVDDFDSPVADIQNTPNPFSGSTVIRVESKKSGDFAFEVFDLLGQRLHRERVALRAGSNEFTFEAGGLAPGIYLYSLSHPEGKVTRMMVVGR